MYSKTETFIKELLRNSRYINKNGSKYRLWKDKGKGI